MAFFKKFRDAQRPCCAALVAAAGSSSRMGGVNKLLQPLDGIPVLARTLTALRAVQTPQIFESALLKAALQAAVEGGIPITDDCSAVERLGKRVYLVEGDEENLKITTPVDLILAEAILQAREDRI